ncbi:copper amine oxidase N-terminal domain-containing protein [Paenibacillus sp. NPDC058174]|uniref:copper amine oxidase N-terminal domain-containing protein n=1 Tax=Paenibacillus sp. NPDC058174 TaxID=3346366 RepID=UPI0036DDFA84
MKRFLTWRTGLALMLALVLVVAAGCQAVNGLNLNTVLKNTLKVTSMEGKQTLELNLLVNEEAYEGLPEEELALIQLFSKLKVQLDDIKLQDASNASYKGKLILGEKASIAFSAKISPKAMLLEIEGAKAPIAIDLTEAGLAELTGLPVDAAGAPSAEAQASLAELGHKVIDSAGDFLINNLPNPQKLSVETVNEPINGVSTSLVHVKAELDGQAIWAWIKSYVDALAADKKGLETFVTTIVTIMSENQDIWTALGEVNPFEDVNLDAATKEETIKEAVKEITDLLLSLQEELKAFEKEDKETLDTIFNKDSSVKAELFVDSKLDIRKQIVEATFKPSDDVLFPIQAIVLRTVSEQWNVNGTVKSDEVVIPAGAITSEQLFNMQAYETLQLFDNKSVVYDLLKNKLQLGHQSVQIYSDYDYRPAIVTPQYVTIIPLRDVAEQLGGVVSYDSKTKQVKVVDKATNTTLAFKEGSDIVNVNGKTVKMPFPATVVNGTLYVPARSFATAVKAKIHWESYGDGQVFVLEREVG